LGYNNYMFSLDDQFLADVGLADMPDDQKEAFKQHIYNELELRVGSRLSEGMSDAQLEEFESIIDHNNDAITAWIAAHAPDYLNDEVYGRMRQALSDATDTQVRDEYAATKWLEINRPDYRDVVARTLDELKQEINQNKDTLLN
jgi:hypothetical protein